MFAASVNEVTILAAVKGMSGVDLINDYAYKMLGLL
jgi:hypothetical protein